LSWWNPSTVPALELSTLLSAADCRQRLARRLAPWYEFWPTEQRPLKGHVGAESFAVYRFRRYRHGFETEARGRFEMAAAGTRLRVRFGFKLYDRIFTVIWLAFTLGLAAVFALLPLHTAPAVRSFVVWEMIGLNVFMLVIFAIVRWINRNDDVFLVRLIESELRATPLPGGGPIE